MKYFPRNIERVTEYRESHQAKYYIKIFFLVYFLNKHKHMDEMDKLELRTPNQMNHKQSVERETSEYIQFSQSREEHLHRTRQLKNKLSHAV